MWTEAIISLTSPSLWWTWSGPVALQEMAGPMAPGPSAMIVFCYGSCEGLATLVLYLHLPMSAVLLLWSWVSGGSQSLHFILKKDHYNLPLTHKVQYFFLWQVSNAYFYFCHSVSCSLRFCLSHCTIFTLNTVSWGKFVRCVWPDLHIYKLWAVQQHGTNCRSEAGTVVKGNGRTQDGSWIMSLQSFMYFV